MKDKELNYEERLSKEVYEGIQELEEGLKQLEKLTKECDDKESLLSEIKKNKRKYDSIPF